MKSKLASAAHKYLDKGWGVIPIREDKKPLVMWKHYQKKLPEHYEVDSWWLNWPKANVGIITGSVSGLVVFDIDSKKGMEFCKARGLPKTPVSRTGKGFHIYTAYPENRHIGNHANPDVGVDVRGEGGYVIAPPSIHPSGKIYSWSQWNPWNVGLAPMTEWMIHHCHVTASNKTRRDGWYHKIFKGITKGGRNHATASLAGRYFRKGLSGQEVVEILLLWNKRNKPPLPEREIIKTVKSIYTIHQQKRGRAKDETSLL